MKAMKKYGELIIVLLLVISLFSVMAIAQDSESDSDDSGKTIEEKAIECVQDETRDKCGSLNVEEQALTVLTVGMCWDELRDNSKDTSEGECWPSPNCKLKETALATLALDSEGGEAWLLSRKKATSDLNWFIQIESSSQTQCRASYDDRDYVIEIGEDKKIKNSVIMKAKYNLRHKLWKLNGGERFLFF